VLSSKDDNTLASGAEEDQEDEPVEPVAVDISELASRTTPGLVGRFATVRSDQLALTDTFERPMAFGVDVLVFPLSNVNIDCTKVEVKAGERKDAITLRGLPEEE